MISSTFDILEGKLSGVNIKQLYYRYKLTMDKLNKEVHNKQY
jgi:hypothetical protein